MAHLLISPKIKFVDSNGLPLAGGKIYSYQAGTTTPLATYVDQTEATPNVNPVILDANGEADVWLGANSYKIVLTDPSDVVLWTSDNIASVNNGSITALKLASNSVTTIKILDGAVTAAKLASNSVTLAKMTSNSVATAQLVDSSVTTAKIAALAVTAAKMAADSVATVNILDANVTAAKLASNSVTTAKVADSSITSPKMSVLGRGFPSFSNSSTSSSSYATIGSSFNITTTGGYLVGQFYANNLGSVFNGYIRLQGADSAGGSSANRLCSVSGSFTLELVESGTTWYFDNTIGHDFVAVATANGTYAIQFPPGAIKFELGIFPAGTYACTLKWKTSAVGTGITSTLSVQNVFFSVHELPLRWI